MSDLSALVHEGPQWRMHRLEDGSFVSAVRYIRNVRVKVTGTFYDEEVFEVVAVPTAVGSRVLYVPPARKA